MGNNKMDFNINLIEKSLLVLFLTHVFILKPIMGNEIPYLGTNETVLGVTFIVYTMFKRYLEKNKEINEIKELLLKKHEEQNHIINKQSEVIAKMTVEIDSVKTSISGIRLGQGYKKPNPIV